VGPGPGSAGGVSIIHTFTGNPLDRAASARRDPGWVAARLADPGTLWLPFHDLCPLLCESDRGMRIAWCRGADLASERHPDGALRESAVLLGVGADGTAYFAVSVDDREFSACADDGPEIDSSGFRDTRAAAALLSASQSAIVAQARSLISWHEAHPFCARCGGPTHSVEAGYSRRCDRAACGAMHFPRTDPVVIMVVCRDDHLLLGRSLREPRYPEGLFSCLAGYIEPGESVEEAVRREVFEEAGIETGRVLYHSSQPWPFPSTLMIGCFAEALSDRVEIDREEVQEVRWFTRQETRTALERWREAGGFRLPPPITAAHQLIAAWLKHDVNGPCDSAGSEVGG
jgi:NAD+ diphosphatase